MSSLKRTFNEAQYGNGTSIFQPPLKKQNTQNTNSFPVYQQINNPYFMQAQMNSYFVQNQMNPYCFCPNANTYKPQNKPNQSQTSSIQILKRFPKFTIMSIRNKGFGWIANSQIECGQVLFAEKPLVIKTTSNSIQKVTQKINGLNNSLLTSFKNLTSISNDKQNLYEIYKTNCLPIHFPKDATAVFLYVSRINHSCTPNAHFYTKGNDKEIKIVALKKIKRNEEITISYIDVEKYNFNTRQSRLNKKYSFKCNCDLCKLGKKIDTSLKKVEYNTRWSRNILDSLQHRPDTVSEDPMWGWNKIVDDSKQAIKIIDEVLNGHPLLKSKLLPLKYIAESKILEHKQELLNQQFKDNIEIKPFMINKELKEQMKYFEIYPNDL